MSAGSLIFLLDECISSRLVDMMYTCGERSVYPLKKQFNVAVADEDWIPEATRRGFVCVTNDRNMLGSDLVAAILSRAGARVVFLGDHFARSRLWDQVLWMFRYWPKIRERAASLGPGDMVRIAKNGRIVTVDPNRPRRNRVQTTRHGTVPAIAGATDQILPF